MDTNKNAKRKDDDQSREPGRHSPAPAQAPEPERRYPDSNRPDTLRPGPGERERKEGARQSDESRMVSVEDDDEVEDDDDEVDAADDDDEDIDDEDIDDEAMPAKPVK